MSFLFSGYTALRGDKGVEQTGGETVHKLCDRVQNSTLLEDRRAAVLGLKGLARDWKLEVGTRGMPVLINVLRNDRMDVDIVKASMETLNILCTAEPDAESPTSPNSQPKKETEDLEIMFTEIFTKDAGNVTLLLDILEEVDFYVRFYTVQLLNTLLLHSGSRLQDCILTSPLGVSRLIDLLDDRREIIRNEGLLLLIALTQNNADIQKIIAFENAFERLLGIIIDEGATDGGIIVQDCLQLTHNLLKYNVSNQNLFRETSCIQRIPTLLMVRTTINDRPVDVPLTDKSIRWTEQKIVNANFVLELIRILGAPKNPSALVNQNVINYAKIVPILNDMSFSPNLPIRVRAQALYAFGDAIRGHKANQDIVSRITLPPAQKPGSAGAGGAPIPAVLQIIKIALEAGEFPLRAAAAYAFECYVYRNPDAQLAVLSTLIPPPSSNPNAENDTENPESAGSLLVSSIVDWESSRKEPFRTWFAATMLAHALNDNLQGQHLALATKLDEGEDAVSLLHKCMYALLCVSRETADVRIPVSILCLLCVWVHECPKAVAELLTEGSNIQFLVEQINQSSGVNSLVQGMAAFLLGLLHEFNDDSEPTFTRASLQSLVTSRIGVDVFASRIERLREAKELNNASQHILKKDLLIGADNQPEVYFDYMFVELFKSSHDRIVRSVTTVEVKGGSPKRKSPQADEDAVKTLKEKLAEQDTELTLLRDKVPALEQSAAEAEQRETEKTLLQAQVTSLEVQLQEVATEHAAHIDTLQEAIEAFKAALAESEQKHQNLINEHEQLKATLSAGKGAEDHEALAAECANLKAALAEKDESYQALAAEHEALKAAQAEREEAHRKLTADHEDLLLMFADTDEELEALKASIAGGVGGFGGQDEQNNEYYADNTNGQEGYSSHDQGDAAYGNDESYTLKGDHDSHFTGYNDYAPDSGHYASDGAGGPPQHYYAHGQYPNAADGSNYAQYDPTGYAAHSSTPPPHQTHAQ
ncbi:Vesicle-mediated ER to Golgi transport protein [Geranomyces variabilis]|nr:Vesicle-mediated ER to Golgi transport protein [Geranomyces variabilis]